MASRDSIAASWSRSRFCSFCQHRVDRSLDRDRPVHAGSQFRWQMTVAGTRFERSERRRQLRLVLFDQRRQAVEPSELVVVIGDQVTQPRQLRRKFHLRLAVGVQDTVHRRTGDRSRWSHPHCLRQVLDLLQHEHDLERAVGPRAGAVELVQIGEREHTVDDDQQQRRSTTGISQRRGRPCRIWP